MKLQGTAIAVLAAAAIIAGAIVLRPAGSSDSGTAFAASKVSNDPGALAQYLRFGGQSSVNVKPDTAEVDVTTTGDATSSNEAIDQASKRMVQVIAALKGMGIAEDDLQSSGVYSYEDYDKSGTFHASQSLSVTVRDVAKAGAVLNTANDAGADQVSGPSFSISDQRTAYRQALKEAIQDARAKADAAAEQMGVKVTGVVSVSDQSDPGPSPLLYAAASRWAKDSTGVPVQPGTLDVGADVVVVFSYA
jgi:uncharacterized protein YggE